MAIDVRATASPADTAATTSTSLTIPSSTVLGDVLLLVTANRDATTDPTVTDDDIFGNRWQRVTGADNTGSGDLWWKRATPQTASKTVTIAGATGSVSASLGVFSGCILTGTPYEAASAQANASGTESHAAITTTGAGRFIVFAVANLNNDNACSTEAATDPATVTERIEHLNTGGNDCATMLAAAAQGAAGSTGAITWAQTNGITVSIALALIPQPTITFIEPGTDSTGDLAFFNSTGGTVASATDQAFTGSRSLKLSTGAPAANAATWTPAAVMADAGRRVSFRVRFDTLPASNADFLHVSDTGGTNAIIALNLRSTGRVRLTAVGATNLDPTTVLSVNKWYRIAFAYTITNSTTYRVDLYIDGALQGSLTTGTLAATGTNLIKWRANSGLGDNASVWFDDMYVDAGVDYTDPGDVRVYALPPAAENSTSFDTAIGNVRSATDYNNVNEVPLSETNGWRHNAISSVQENYTVRTRTDAGLLSVPVIGRTAWIWAKGAAGGAGTPGIVDNGTVTAITLTSAGKLFTVTTTTNDYPSNAAGIGMRATNNADDSFFYEGGQNVAVLWVPPVPAGLMINQSVKRAAQW